MTLQLKAAKRVLLAAGYDESEISELVRGIKADAWDKGIHAVEAAQHDNTDPLAHAYANNPYRTGVTHEPIVIRRNDDGTLDEIVANDAQVHVEQMDDNRWWMGIYDADGCSWMVDFTTPRAKIACNIWADQISTEGAAK